METLIARLKTHIINKTTDVGENLFTNPTQEYLSLEKYQQEISWIKTQIPLPVADIYQLANDGDYVTTTLYGYPLLIINSQNQIKVFLNICKHRAAKLINSEAGKIQEIICPYHGWKYHLNGQLKEITEEKLAAPELCKEKIKLTELPFIVEAGLIWTILKPSSQILEQHFSPLTKEFQLLQFNQYKSIDRFSLIGNFNWKIAVESFLEIYHFNYLHGKSITNQKYHHICLFDKMDQHSRITIPMNNFMDQFEKNLEPELLPHSNIMYFIFPCHFILLMRNFYAFIAITPLMINQCQIEVKIFVPLHRQDDELLKRANQSLQGLQYIISEDIRVCESLQQNIETGEVKTFNYTKLESMIEHFHLTLRKKLSRP